MSWKRGNSNTDYELARVQDKVETWSEIFDGDQGMIRIFQSEQAVQTEREKEHEKSQKRTMLFCACCALIPVVHDVPGWIHALFAH